MPTLQELLDQKAALEHQITVTRNEERSQAVASIRAIMTEHGLSPEQLMVALNAPGKTKASKGGDNKARGKVAAKYLDAETGNSWTGRGLKPKWLTAALAAGKTLEDFAL